ncbi:PKD domain-containing protein [Sorangium sp. So ce291]|uniref:PKD domain-containing protein n=1 Tax=Sorangium sp. So ce291 TaxID=3133294 RepID=UPI003F609590
MKHRFTRRMRGSMALALAIAAPACDSGKGGSDEGSSAETGSLQAALTVGGARHDVTAIHYKVVGASDTCDDTAIAEATRAVEDEALPGSVLPPGAGTHAGADGLFVLPPGDYRVCATPMSDSGPSRECAPAEGMATVLSEATTEIVLVSQCGAGENGGLGTVVTLNDPPRIEGLEISPSRFITQCERATITATATDPDGDAIAYSWELLAGDGTVSSDANVATFTPAGAGDATVRVTVTDVNGGSAGMYFPIHVSAADCGSPACEVFGADSFGYVGCSRAEDVPSCDDISLTGSPACGDDDCTTSVTLPFTFDYYGTPRTSVDISSNGTLGFPSSGSYSNSCSLEPQTIAPFWDDLYPPAGGGVRYETLGSAPARRFVVQWNVARYGGGSSLYDVRAVLFEGSNDIRFCYADTTAEDPSVDNGASATAGISGSSDSLLYSCEAPQLTEGLVLEFAHPTGFATCSDGIQNQGETGVDCGGPCGACATCSDGIQNQGETGVDCGGPCGACGGGASFLTSWGGTDWYKVQVNGLMTDANILAACQAAGLAVPCQTNSSCFYNDSICSPVTGETSCGNPMSGLSESLCGDTFPSNCPALFNTFQYMGGMWSGGCGALSGEWCVPGDSYANGLALCTGTPAAATCSDGIQNQGETGVDCGGPCGACGGGGVSRFTFTDTTADDVSSTALYDFFTGLGPVSASQYILFEVNGAWSGGAWCAGNADFYVNGYLNGSSISSTEVSGSWDKYTRPLGGAWSGPDTAGYTNYFGQGCDGQPYSWCSEWGLGGLTLGVMPSQPDLSLGESFSSDGWSTGASLAVTIAVGGDRLSTCGF